MGRMMEDELLEFSVISDIALMVNASRFEPCPTHDPSTTCD